MEFKQMYNRFYNMYAILIGIVCECVGEWVSLKLIVYVIIIIMKYI